MNTTPPQLIQIIQKIQSGIQFIRAYLAVSILDGTHKHMRWTPISSCFVADHLDAGTGTPKILLEVDFDLPGKHNQCIPDGNDPLIDIDQTSILCVSIGSMSLIDVDLSVYATMMTSSSGSFFPR